jgi:hypothetical protein
MNIEHRTSNAESKDEKTEIDFGYAVMEVCFLFDVGRWTFDVRCSFFYGAGLHCK